MARLMWRTLYIAPAGDNTPWDTLLDDRCTVHTCVRTLVIFEGSNGTRRWMRRLREFVDKLTEKHLETMHSDIPLPRMLLSKLSVSQPKLKTLRVSLDPTGYRTAKRVTRRQANVLSLAFRNLTTLHFQPVLPTADNA